MEVPASVDDIEFGGPGTYRIVVQGALSEEWSARLAGLAIAITNPGEAAPRSSLVGRIRDQAELRGVLESLYELHMPIIAVERMPSDTGDTAR